MRFQNVFVRGIAPSPVPQDEIIQLAKLLAERPAEWQLNSRGARCDNTLVELRAVSTLLARRNVRSLIALNTTFDRILEGLEAATTHSPDDAEAALDDGGIELNVRQSTYVTGDASISLQGTDLVITDGTPVSVRIPRTDIRRQGATFFSPEALARLASLPVEAIQFSPAAILPVALQREPGALMEPDTAQQRLHKGDWRSTRKLGFAKSFCITCSKCFIHCPDNAIIHAMYDKAQKDATGILGIDYDRCTACGICVSVCPTDRNGYRALVLIDIHAEETKEHHHVG